jgi:hypothetical protein
VSRFERIGYVVWGTVALVVAIPEIAALAAHDVPWPTISGTIGHLEDLWHPTAVIVVAVIVVAAALAVGYGRIDTRAPTAAPAGQWWPFLYLGSAVVFVVGAGLIVSAVVDNRFVLAT